MLETGNIIIIIVMHVVCIIDIRDYYLCIHVSLFVGIVMHIAHIARMFHLLPISSSDHEEQITTDGPHMYTQKHDHL